MTDAAAPVCGLDGLLAPVTVEEFRTGPYGRAPRVFRGPSDRFAGLVTWSDVNAVLAEHHHGWAVTEFDGVAHRRLSPITEGHFVDPEAFRVEQPGRRTSVRRVDPVMLNHFLREGGSLAFDSAEELFSPVALLAEDVERQLGETVSVNFYASTGNDSGLSWHWDNQDAFVLQIEGRKYWEIAGCVESPIDPQGHRAGVTLTHDASDPVPIAHDPTMAERRARRGRRVVGQAERPDLPTAWSGWLEPGDAVYIPRGCWHHVHALDGPGHGLTVRVFRARGGDLLEWAVAQVRAHPEVDADLERAGPVDGRRARAQRLRELISEVLDDEAIDRFYASRDAAARPRRVSYSLPWSATRAVIPEGDDVLLRLLAPRAPVVRRPVAGSSEVSVAEGCVELLAMGRTWVIGEEQLAVIEPLYDGRARALSELVPAGRTSAETRALVVDLVLSGLLGVVAPS